MAATLRSTYPSRYGHFASVPMPDVDGTLAEIAYALDQLRADGIQLMTSYGEGYPGHPDFAPVMDELNRRKALVFVHPLAPVCCAPSLGWIQPALLELRLRRSLPTSQHRRFLLGSDFPFGTSADGIRGLEEYGLKPSDLEAIYRGNAERPLPRLKV